MAYQALTQTVKAERASILLAGKEVEVFRMPNGSYKYSTTSTTAAIGKNTNDWANYQRSIKGSTSSHLLPENTLNTLQEAGSTSSHLEKQPTLVSVGRTRIKAVDDVEVAAYWVWKSVNGNKEALALTTALTVEALKRRADTAFGVKVSEAQYEADTALVREQLLTQYKALDSQLRDIPVFSKDRDPVLLARDTIYYEQLTELEKEVLKERRLDEQYPQWREDEDESDLVTNCQGEVSLTEAQKQYYRV